MPSRWNSRISKVGTDRSTPSVEPCFEPAFDVESSESEYELASSDHDLGEATSGSLSTEPPRALNDNEIHPLVQMANDAKNFLDRLDSTESHDDLQTLLAATLRLPGEAPPYVSLWYHDTAPGEDPLSAPLLLVTETGNTVATVAPAHNRIMIGQGLVGRAMEQVLTSPHEPSSDDTREAHMEWDLSIPDQQDFALAPDFVRAERLASSIAIAWRSTRTPNGVLLICSRLERVFSDVQRAAFSLIGRQALNHLPLLSRNNLVSLIQTMTATATIGRATPDELILHILTILKDQLSADSVYLVSKSTEVPNKVSFLSDSNLLSMSSADLMLAIQSLSAFRLYQAGGSPDELTTLAVRHGFPHDVLERAVTSLAAVSPPFEQVDHLVCARVPTSSRFWESAALLVRRSTHQSPFMPEDEILLASISAVAGTLISSQAEMRQARRLLDLAIAPAEDGDVNLVVDRLLEAIAGLPQVVEAVALHRATPAGQWRVLTNTAVSGPLKGGIGATAAYRLMTAGTMTAGQTDEVSSFIDESAAGLGGVGSSSVMTIRYSDTETHAIVAFFLETPPQAVHDFLTRLAQQAHVTMETVALRESLANYKTQMERIARESTSAMITVSLGHEVKNGLHGLDASMDPLEQIARTLRSSETMTVRRRNEYAKVLMETASDVSSEVQRLDELAKLLRDIVAGDGTPAQQKETHINGIVEVFRAVLNDKAKQSRVDLVFLPDPLLSSSSKGGWRLRCDPSAVGLALINLVDNAIAASKPGGRIEVSTALLRTDASDQKSGGPRDGRVQLTVRDYGRGVELHDRGRLFEPFFTTKPQGHGLGLAITKNVVERDGGEILVNFRVSPGLEVGLEYTAVSPAGEKQ